MAACPVSATGVRPQGLVICAKTRRGSCTPAEPQVTDAALEALTSYRPSFASPAAVATAAHSFEQLAAWSGHEGPRARITVGPRMIQISRPDLARRERALERAAAARVTRANLLAAYLERTGGFPPDPVPTREVTSWSRKSRNNMTRTFAKVDFTPMFVANRPPAMVTLTYPGQDWALVAPDGRTVKQHMAKLRRRYRRAWGEDLMCLWKLEFQRRGAPHVHMFMVPPVGRSHGQFPGLMFRHWLSEVWADIVAHPDAFEREKHRRVGTQVKLAYGLAATDPNGIVDYFEKHGGGKGGKEYQHIVPEVWRAPGMGPGRFWGYWSLELGARAVEVPEDVAIWAARTARRFARASGRTTQKSVPRYAGGRLRADRRSLVVLHPGEAPRYVQQVDGLAGAQLVDAYEPTRRWRKVRRRIARFVTGAGWLHSRDGAGFAEQLARAIRERFRPFETDWYSFVPQRDWSLT
jgi:hypothetical protein